MCDFQLSESELDDIKKDIIEKTVKGMAAEGRKYIGEFLFIPGKKKKD